MGGEGRRGREEGKGGCKVKGGGEGRMGGEGRRIREDGR